IECVVTGDEVRSWYGPGDFRPARVVRTHRSTPSDGIAITTRRGRRLVSTPDHVHFAGSNDQLCQSVPTMSGQIDRVRGSVLEIVGLPTARRADEVGAGMTMLDERGEADTVVSVERIALDAAVYDIDVDQVHNFVANGIVTHNSIYKFRGADFRNLLRFEEAFPEATVVVLDQNYRSTQRILDAANAVIANNPSHRPKHLWSEHGLGEPIVRYQAEDEHDE